MNIGDQWSDLIEAEHRVLVIETKLRQWAKADPGRRFDDLANLVYDPAFLVVAWAWVRDSKGARTAGVDGVRPRSIVFGAAELLDQLRVDLKAAGLFHSGCGRIRSRKRTGKSVSFRDVDDHRPGRASLVEVGA